jgi:tRNA A-37 threonylcarbamoyl transferase component Bud32
MSDGTLVQRLQEDVADRQPVDWTALMSELQATNAASPDLLQEVSLLRLLDEIGQAHATLQSEPLGDEPLPHVEASADDTLKAWGRYVLEERVGRGGFGSVYRAWDPVLEMAVALKILHQRYSDDRLKERLLHEGRALAQLRHPNVVRVLNVEQHDGRLGLVMEFLSGETMDALVAAHGKLSDREASVIVEDVCRALAAVHANGLIHRDVKARNIIREPAGRIVLMDFGAGLSMRTTEAPGTAVGTPLYMAPETLNGAPATPASDVYGVGVLLFYLVTGRYPYEGGSFDEIRDAHAARRANSLLGLRPDLPVRFVKVVDRAVALDVAGRYQTPDALLQALTDLGGAVNRGRWAWVRPALYAGAALLALMAVGGMLSSVAYNAALGRGAYQHDTFVQKFGWGAQALFLPIVLTCLAAGLAGAMVAVRRVLVAASTGVRALDRRMAERGRAIAVRLALTDPPVCASWLLLVTAVCAGLIWTYWTPLLLAVTTDISFAPAEMLAVFSPALAPYRTGYRMALSLLVAGNIAGWFVMRRASGRRTTLPVWIVATEVALVVLLLMSMLLPYRLLHHIEKADAVTWRGQQCYVVGKGPTDDLLYCSRMSPRIYVVPRTGVPLPPSSPKEHPFAPFSPAGR